MVEHGVVILGGEECAGEDDTVEGDVVLAHELVELHVLRVLPPPLPAGVGVVGSDRQIPDGGIIPHVEYFVLVVFPRDRRAPLQVACDAAALQAFLQQGRGKLDGIRRPLTFNSRLRKPLLMNGLDLGQINEDVLRLPDNRLRRAKLATRVEELDSI